MRFRYVFLLFGCLTAALLLLIVDPGNNLDLKLPFGSALTVDLIYLLRVTFYVAVLHLARKALIDYIDLQEYFNNAKKTPEASGYAIIGVGLIMVSIAIMTIAAVK